MTILRRPVRSRPIRRFLIVMFAVPLVSLVALWGFAASITVRSAVADHNYNASTRAITNGVETLTLGLPAEREASYLWLVSDRTSSKVPLLATRKVVDAAIPEAKSAIEFEFGSFSPDSRAAVNAMFAQLGQIGEIRAAVDSGTISPLAAFQAYDGMIDAQYRFFKASIENRDPTLGEVSIGAVDVAYAYEMASREATLVAGAMADRGQMSASARQLFASSAANRSLLMNDALIFLSPSLRAPYLSIVNSPDYQQYQAMESQISASTGGPVPVNAVAWQAASGAYLTEIENAEVQSGTALAAMSASLSDRLATEAVLAGGIGLLAVVVSVILLVWFGRKVTQDLTRLDGSVRGMAQERLPRVVEQLGRGDDVDVTAESPPPDTSTIREVDRIAESFATVQTAAVTAAVDQARMRKGVNQVFLNISMRNQSLLHRQLAMLDSMERRTTEPGALADLFRLDHLTTRMRRHAEGLIILSGSTPGRGWNDPVPVVDVLRAAVAEVEDYVRVDVVSESRDLVAGSVVNDVIHLVAELVENATVFSPPNTRIEVRADRVGAGLVAEIEDRGLGLDAEDLDDLNRTLASPPEFDLADSHQLGLFVVGRLAARHNIKVSLRPSVYGGLTAVLLLPFGVIVREEDLSRANDPREVPPGAADAQDLPPDNDWLALSSGESAGRADDPAPPGLTGRHRLASSMSGRMLMAGASARAQERQQAEPPETSPRRPEELQQAAPRARAALPPPLPAPGPEPPAWTPGAAAPAWVATPMTTWSGAFEPAVTRRPEPPPDEPRADSDDAQSLVPPSRSPAGAGRPRVVSSGSHLGMPIRVPQASLAPQLRGRRQAGRPTMAPDDPEAVERPPEVTRSMMTLMQQGWQRGRVDDLDEPEGAPGNGSD
jgi:signal transduction histidine kinase